MSETSSTPKIPMSFILPTLEHEVGEIQNAVKLYGAGDREEFLQEFLETFKKSELVDLDEATWSQLRNTDSYDIAPGDWDAIERNIQGEARVWGAPRDWRGLKEKVERGEAVEAPIILKYQGQFHKVGGNTRLMVARAFGQTPKVLIVDMENALIKIENRATFLQRLEDRVSREEIQEIDFAYDLAKEAHRPATRDSGVRYFEHPRAGCLILMDELGIYDRDLLVSFLFHDVGEDTPVLGQVGKSYDDFREKAEFRLNRLFGEKVADIVIRLTKPAIDNVRFHSKEDVFAFYLAELAKSEETILLKMVDRLHNLRSLPGNKPDKIKRQISETRNVYVPIFKSIQGEHKGSSERLLKKIEDQLSKLETDSK